MLRCDQNRRSNVQEVCIRRVAESNRDPWQDLPVINRLQATGLSPSYKMSFVGMLTSLTFESKSCKFLESHSRDFALFSLGNKSAMRLV